MAIKPTGEEVQLAAVVTPPPAEEASGSMAPAAETALPSTASPLPLIGLFGLLALGGAFALRAAASAHLVGRSLICRAARPRQARRAATTYEGRKQHATESHPAPGADDQAPAERERLLRDQGSRAGRAQFAAVEQGDGLHGGRTKSAGPHRPAPAGHQHAGDSGQARLHPVSSGCRMR